MRKTAVIQFKNNTMLRIEYLRDISIDGLNHTVTIFFNDADVEIYHLADILDVYTATVED